MDLKDLLECGNYFVLCEHCSELTVFEFRLCHKCKKHIDRDKYKQFSTLEKYDIMISALQKFDNNIVNECFSMISIEIVNDNNIVPELWQIHKENNQYKFVHFEIGTHKILRESTIYPDNFVPILNPNKQYKISLVYGPNVIYIAQ